MRSYPSLLDYSLLTHLGRRRVIGFRSVTSGGLTQPSDHTDGPG